MNITLYLAPGALRRWHLTLIDRLAPRCTGLSLVFANPSPVPRHIEQLMQFERRFYHKSEEHGSAPVSTDQLCQHLAIFAADTIPTDSKADYVIDLAGDGNAPTGHHGLTLLYDGHPGEAQMLAAIMAHGLPQIAFQDEEGAICATAQPSAELAIGVSGSMDQVTARIMTLLDAYLDHPDRWTQPLISRKASLPGKGQLAMTTAKSLVRSSLMAVYRRLFRPSHWRIGWRWVDGEDVWTRRALAGEPWTVLPDKDNHFYADPVPCVWQGRHFLFFEDLPPETNKGLLSVIEFDEGGPKGPAKACLEEDYHLSYPYLIEHEGEMVMIPETSNHGDVALYRAKNFPFGWERSHVLIKDIDAADVTITRQEGKYWIFCVTRDGAGGYSDCLSLFHADTLLGPWQPHAQNPVLIDTATARPAGNFYEEDGKLLRPVQDCTKSYGAEMRLMEVTKLTPTEFEQEEVAHLVPNARWPGRKLHTLNRAGRLEVVDGAILRPRFEPLLSWITAKQAPEQGYSSGEGTNPAEVKLEAHPSHSSKQASI